MTSKYTKHGRLPDEIVRGLDLRVSKVVLVIETKNDEIMARGNALFPDLPSLPR